MLPFTGFSMIQCGHTLNFSHMKTLKPHDDESEDSNNDSKFDTFAEKLNST